MIDFHIVKHIAQNIVKNNVVRYADGIDSALYNAEYILYSSGQEEDAVMKSSAYIMIGIARNHPFKDGNKRTAFISGLYALREAGISFHATDIEAAVENVVLLAQGKMNLESVSAWLKDNTTQGEPLIFEGLSLMDCLHLQLEAVRKIMDEQVEILTLLATR